MPLPRSLTIAFGSLPRLVALVEQSVGKQEAESQTAVVLHFLRSMMPAKGGPAIPSQLITVPSRLIAAATRLITIATRLITGRRKGSCLKLTESLKKQI